MTTKRPIAREQVAALAGLFPHDIDAQGRVASALGFPATDVTDASADNVTSVGETPGPNSAWHLLRETDVAKEADWHASRGDAA